MNAIANSLPPELLEEPRYRVAGDNWVDGGVGIAQPPGSEFICRGWPPKGGIEPVNEPAKRIFDYDRAGRMGFGPSVPYDFKLGRFYLPDLSASDERSKRVLIVASERVVPGMPSYRALVDIPLQRYGLGDDRNAFGRDIHVGQTIVSLAWPKLISAYQFEAADEPATSVRAYYDANREHPGLPLSPWCWFLRALHLPALPELRRRGHDHDDDFRQARPDPITVRSHRGRGTLRPIEA